MLKENSPGPRVLYLETLAKTGTPTKESMEALNQGMRDKDVKVRLYSAQLVGKVEPNNPAVVSVLIETLQEKDAAVRRLAAQALGEIRPRDEAVQEALREAVMDMDAAVRTAAQEALKKFKK
jgi:HEAT repeat protein